MIQPSPVTSIHKTFCDPYDAIYSCDIFLSRNVLQYGINSSSDMYMYERFVVQPYNVLLFQFNIYKSLTSATSYNTYILTLYPIHTMLTF